MCSADEGLRRGEQRSEVSVNCWVRWPQRAEQGGWARGLGGAGVDVPGDFAEKLAKPGAGEDPSPTRVGDGVQTQAQATANRPRKGTRTFRNDSTD